MTNCRASRINSGGVRRHRVNVNMCCWCVDVVKCGVVVGMAGAWQGPWPHDCCRHASSGINISEQSNVKS